MAFGEAGKGIVKIEARIGQFGIAARLVEHPLPIVGGHFRRQRQRRDKLGDLERALLDTLTSAGDAVLYEDRGIRGDAPDDAHGVVLGDLIHGAGVKKD